MTIDIHHGDCLEVLKTIADNSIDSIVTDPPYGLSFMGKKWDYDVPSVAIWQECLRVLKPGGHLLSFSGTRTYHRLVVNVEDAGFEIRDQIGWLYGSGFPKSHNLKDEWTGWGTALKPAWEPCVLARKPLTGTVAANVLQYGTGALNIDASRIPITDKLGGGTEKEIRIDQKGNEGWTRPWMENEESRTAHAERIRTNVAKAENLGRWPANVIHDGSDEVLEAFAAFGVKTSGVKAGGCYARNSGVHEGGQRLDGTACYADSGTAARFFYNAKASKADRAGSKHPTVKPLALMRYLVTLVSPPGGTVLDPFAGSGTTGQAAVEAGMNVVLIEREAEYVEDISRRLMSSAD